VRTLANKITELPLELTQDHVAVTLGTGILTTDLEQELFSVRVPHKAIYVFGTSDAIYIVPRTTDVTPVNITTGEVVIYVADASKVAQRFEVARAPIAAMAELQDAMKKYFWRKAFKRTAQTYLVVTFKSATADGLADRANTLLKLQGKQIIELEEP